MKKPLILTFFVLLNFNLVLTSNSLNAQWQMYPSGYPNAICYSVKFLNENTGYMTGGFDGLFLKSINGGMNWSGQQITSSQKNFIGVTLDMHFFDENTGYVVGGSNNVYKTTDGAASWEMQTVPFIGPTMIYNSIFFLNESTGYICGRFGHIAKTTNSGENWNHIYQSPHSGVVTIWFVDENNGIAGDQDGGIYKTTDGGMNWKYNQLTDHEGYYYAHNNIQFINGNTGFIFGLNLFELPKRSVVYKTTDIGNSWEMIYYGLDKHITNGYFFDENRGFITGIVSYMEYTSNSGLTWENIFVTPISDGLLGIDFINENTGFISSAWGNVFKTTNGGIVSINNETQLIPEGFYISKAFPNPFNPVTNITIELNQGTINSGELYLEIFDARGSLVKKEKINRGIGYKITHQIEMNENQSGIYFARISSGNVSSNTIKLVLLK